MVTLIEKGSPWNRGYAFACVKNKVETTFDTITQKSMSAIYLKRLRVYEDYSVLPKLIAALTFSQKVRDFFSDCVIVTMPASKARERQPVNEIARELGRAFNVQVLEQVFPMYILDTTSKIPYSERYKSRAYETILCLEVEALADIDKTQRIVMFDDYYDTGKSMTNAVLTLNEEGYFNVDIFTVCCTQRAKKRFKEVWKYKKQQKKLRENLTIQ